MLFSKSVVGDEEYFEMYNILNDTIKSWIKNELDYFKYYEEERDWILDSVLCINAEGSKMITSVLKRSLSNESTGDFIDYFYGVNISGTWYFFMGPHLVLPREFYQEDIHTSLSFEKLKQIATMNIYRGYLRKGKKGKWEVNERFFSDLTSVAWCMDCATQQEWDSVYIKIVQDNWKK